MELYRRVGQTVAELRRSRGLSQSALAARLGMSRASIANLENGRQRIMVHQLFALVSALNLNSILDLVPTTWESQHPFPDIVTTGSTLNAQQRSAIAYLLATAFAEEPAKEHHGE